MLASNETPFAPQEAVGAAAAQGACRRQPLSRPLLRSRCARALSERYGLAPERIALGCGSLRHPPVGRRGAARARRRGRLRVAGLQRLPPPRRRLGRPRDRGAARLRGAPRPRRDARRDHRRDPAGADLQPQQPDLDGAWPRARSRQFLARVPPHVCVILDEAYCEFSLALGDPYASRRAAQPLSEPGAAANLLEGLRARRAAGRLRALRHRHASGPRSTRCASRSI